VPVIVRDLNISIKNINDVLRCLSLASMLEVAGWPKPGNVHRTKNFNKTKLDPLYSTSSFTGSDPVSSDR